MRTKLVFGFIAAVALVLSGCASTPTATPAESLSQTPAAAAPASETPTVAEDVATPSEEAPAPAAVGTPENPLKVGTAATVGDWTVTVVSVTKNATTKVVNANMFNAKPAKGVEYTLVTLKATYHGDGKGDAGMDLSVSFLGNDATVYTNHDALVVAPNDLSSAKSVVKGGTTKGSTVLAVPISVMSAGGLLAVEETLSFDGSPVNWKI